MDYCGAKGYVAPPPSQIILRLCQRTRKDRIRGGTEDNLKNFFLISQRKHIVTPHLNRLTETVLMVGHKIFFHIL